MIIKYKKFILVLFSLFLFTNYNVYAMYQLNLKQSVVNNIDESEIYYIVNIPYKRSVAVIPGVNLHHPISKDGILHIKIPKLTSPLMPSIKEVFDIFQRKKAEPFLIYILEDSVFINKKEYKLENSYNVPNKFSLVVAPKITTNDPKPLKVGILAACNFAKQYCVV